MRLFTVTAELTIQGIKYRENANECTQKGANTFVTTGGTYFNAKTLLLIKDVGVNFLPGYRSPRFTYKTVCKEEDLEIAKNILFVKIKEQLFKCVTSLQDLQIGFEKGIICQPKTEIENGSTKRKRKQR